MMQHRGPKSALPNTAKIFNASRYFCIAVQFCSSTCCMCLRAGINSWVLRSCLPRLLSRQGLPWGWQQTAPVLPRAPRLCAGCWNCSWGFFLLLLTAEYLGSTFVCGWFSLLVRGGISERVEGIVFSLGETLVVFEQDSGASELAELRGGCRECRNSSPWVLAWLKPCLEISSSRLGDFPDVWTHQKWQRSGCCCYRRGCRLWQDLGILNWHSTAGEINLLPSPSHL